MRMTNEKILERLHGFDKIVITCHVTPDGDAIGSSNSLGLYLENMGKDVKITYPEKIPDKYKFLPRPSKVEEFSIENKGGYSGEHTQVLVTLDSSDEFRVSPVIEQVNYKYLINIDHHPTNTYFGDLNLVDSEKAATCQILYDLFEASAIDIDIDIGTNLYAGILTDTGCFRFENADQKAFETAAKLVGKGVKSHVVAREIYESIPVKTFYFMRELLNTLDITSDHKIAWLSCSNDLVNKYNVGAGELEGVINFPKNLKPVEFALLFKETEDGYTKVGMRSKNYDVGKIAKEYSGGGHKRAAGCFFNTSLEVAKKEIIERLQAELNKEAAQVERDH